MKLFMFITPQRKVWRIDNIVSLKLLDTSSRICSREVLGREEQSKENLETSPGSQPSN